MGGVPAGGLRCLLLVLCIVACEGNCGTYTCSGGYTLRPVPSGIVCAVTGTPCPTLPANDVVCCFADCAVPTVAGAFVTACTEGGTVISGTDCAWTSETGYTCTDIGTQTCTDGNFPATPACNVISCTVAYTALEAAAANVQLPAATLACDTVPEATCALTCITGYFGAPELDCTAADTWSVSPPCLQNTCSASAAITNQDPQAADYTNCDGKLTGQTCIPTCNTGYVVSGIITLTCGATGGFDATGATCDVITCSVAFTPATYNVDPLVTTGCDTAIEPSCALTCAAGYTGTPTLSCTAADTWTVSATCADNCIAEAASTLIGTDLPTGTDSIACPAGSFTAPSPTCTVSACEAGYTATGTSLVTCSTAGVITGAAGLACTEQACNTYTLTAGITQGTCPFPVVLSPITNPSCTLNCGVGYLQTGGTTALSCSPTALTPTTTLVCTAIMCTTTFDFAANNVAVVSTLPCDSVPEGSCPLTCLPGYVSAAIPALGCTAANTWAVTDPCQTARCSVPFDFATNNIVASTTVACNEVLEGPCNLACLSGWSGNPILECTAIDTWSLTNTCTENSCAAYNFPVGVQGGTPAACIDGVVLTTTATPSCDLECVIGYSGAAAALTCPSNAANGQVPTTSVSCVATCGTYTCASPVGVLLSTPNSVVCPSSACTDTLCCVGVVVAPPTLTTTEAGSSSAFTVVLLSPPTADVDIPIVNTDTTEGQIRNGATLGPAFTLTFTAADWDQPQTVTVTGVDDTAFDGDVTYAVRVDAATSTDLEYDGYVPLDVAVTNIEDEQTDTISATPTYSMTHSASVSESTSVTVSESLSATASISLTESISLSPTQSVTPSLTFSKSLTYTLSATQSVSQTLSISSTPSQSLTATFSESETLTESRTPTVSLTPTFTESASLTFSLTDTVSLSRTPSATFSLTVTLTPTTSLTTTPTATISLTPTYTYSLTHTTSLTPTFSLTPTDTYSLTHTTSLTPTFSLTSTFTFSLSATETLTPTASISETPTFSLSLTETFSRSATISVTPTFSLSKTETISVTPSLSTSLTFSVTETVTMPTLSATFTHSATLPTPTESNTITFTIPTPTPSITVSLTVPTPTVSFTGTFTLPTPTSTFTTSLTPTISVTPTYSISLTPTFSLTHTTSLTTTFSLTNTLSLSNTISPTVTPTFTPTLTPSLTETISPTQSASMSATFTPSVNVPTLTGTDTVTFTLSETFTENVTDTSSLTVTQDYVRSETVTPPTTKTVSVSLTMRTATPSESIEVPKVKEVVIREPRVFIGSKVIVLNNNVWMTGDVISTSLTGIRVRTEADGVDGVIYKIVLPLEALPGDRVLARDSSSSTWTEGAILAPTRYSDYVIDADAGLGIYNELQSVDLVFGTVVAGRNNRDERWQVGSMLNKVDVDVIGKRTRFKQVLQVGFRPGDPVIVRSFSTPWGLGVVERVVGADVFVRTETGLALWSDIQPVVLPSCGAASVIPRVVARDLQAPWGTFPASDVMIQQGSVTIASAVYDQMQTQGPRAGSLVWGRPVGGPSRIMGLMLDSRNGPPYVLDSDGFARDWEELISLDIEENDSVAASLDGTTMFDGVISDTVATTQSFNPVVRDVLTGLPQTAFAWPLLTLRGFAKGTAVFVRNGTETGWRSATWQKPVVDFALPEVGRNWLHVFPSDLALSELVLVRDSDTQFYMLGTVLGFEATSQPIVRLNTDGSSATWRLTERAGYRVGDRVLVKDDGPWEEGVVTASGTEPTVTTSLAVTRQWQSYRPVDISPGKYVLVRETVSHTWLVAEVLTVTPETIIANTSDRSPRAWEQITPFGFYENELAHVRDSSLETWSRGKVAKVNNNDVMVSVPWNYVQPQIFCPGDTISVRDSDNNMWREGVVESVNGGLPRVSTPSSKWNEIEPAGYRVGDSVLVRDDNSQSWVRATVTSVVNEVTIAQSVTQEQKSWAEIQPENLATGTKVLVKNSNIDPWVTGVVTNNVLGTIRVGGGLEATYKQIQPLGYKVNDRVMVGDTIEGPWMKGVVKEVLPSGEALVTTNTEEKLWKHIHPETATKDAQVVVRDTSEEEWKLGQIASTETDFTISVPLVSTVPSVWVQVMPPVLRDPPGVAPVQPPVEIPVLPIKLPNVTVPTVVLRVTADCSNLSNSECFNTAGFKQQVATVLDLASCAPDPTSIVNVVSRPDVSPPKHLALTVTFNDCPNRGWTATELTQRFYNWLSDSKNQARLTNIDVDLIDSYIVGLLEVVTATVKVPEEGVGDEEGGSSGAVPVWPFVLGASLCCCLLILLFLARKLKEDRAHDEEKSKDTKREMIPKGKRVLEEGFDFSGDYEVMESGGKPHPEYRPPPPEVYEMQPQTGYEGYDYDYPDIDVGTGVRVGPAALPEEQPAPLDTPPSPIPLDPTSAYVDIDDPSPQRFATLGRGRANTRTLAEAGQAPGDTSHSGQRFPIKI